MSSASSLIDGEGTVRGELGPDEKVWHDAPIDQQLSEVAGGPVRALPAATALQRSLRTMRNPLNFLATAYPRTAYEQVEGYRGSRLMNPDKWFHWRLLTAVESVCFVERPLFSYRWHATNQTALQVKDGALKALVDDYTSTFELDQSALDHAQVSRDELVGAFVEFDIARHGLATLARGDRHQAGRILAFGRACYPAAVRRNRKVIALRVLRGLGPVGVRVAASAYGRSADQRESLADLVTRDS